MSATVIQPRVARVLLARPTYDAGRSPDGLPTSPQSPLQRKSGARRAGHKPSGY
jgi:hypothetical protein